jgi:hypothetical protein
MSWPGSGQPVAFLKLSALRHHVRECLFAAGDALRQHDAGIVAGLDDYAAQKVLDLHAVADMHEHLRALHAPGPFADRQRILELELAMLQFFKHQIERHQLADGCRRNRVIRGLLQEHGPGLGFNQDGLVGGGVDGRRQRGGGRYNASETDREGSLA